MALEPHRHRFDDRDGAPRARPLERSAHCVVHGRHVGAVDEVALGVAAVRQRAEGERGRRVLQRPWRAKRPLVVLDDEHQRQPHDRGDVERLVDVARARRSLADERQHRVVGVAIPLGERTARADGHQRAEMADKARDPRGAAAHVQAAVPALRHAGRPAADLREDVDDGHVTNDVRAEIADGEGRPLLGPQGRRRSHRGGFVARAGEVLAVPQALAQQLHDLAIDGTRQRHLPVEFDLLGYPQRRRRDVVPREAICGDMQDALLEIRCRVETFEITEADGRRVRASRGVGHGGNDLMLPPWAAIQRPLNEPDPEQAAGHGRPTTGLIGAIRFCCGFAAPEPPIRAWPPVPGIRPVGPSTAVGPRRRRAGCRCAASPAS